MATTAATSPPFGPGSSPDAQDGQLALCASYLSNVFQSTHFLTAQGHNPAATQQRILSILADPQVDQDDRIDAVRAELETCLRLNTAAGTASSTRAQDERDDRRGSGASVSSAASGAAAAAAAPVPDSQLDDLVLELMHRLQQDRAGPVGKPVGGPAPSFRPPRPGTGGGFQHQQQQPGKFGRVGGLGPIAAPELVRTHSSGSAVSLKGTRSLNAPLGSAALASNNDPVLGVSTLSLGSSGTGTGTSGNTPLASPRPWTPSGGSVGSGGFGTTFGTDSGFMTASEHTSGAFSARSPFASPGTSPRLWNHGLPLPLVDSAQGSSSSAAAAAFRAGISGTPTTSGSSSSNSPFVSGLWSGPPAFSISTSAAGAGSKSLTSPSLEGEQGMATTIHLAPELQRTSSDLGGEPTSPPMSKSRPLSGSAPSRGAPGSAVGSATHGPPGLSVGGGGAQQPFARIATTNAAAKAAAAAAAASAKTSAIGSERDGAGGDSAEFRPRWDSVASSSSSSAGPPGASDSGSQSGRRPSDLDDEDGEGNRGAFTMHVHEAEDAEDGEHEPRRLGSAALSGESPSPKRNSGESAQISRGASSATLAPGDNQPSASAAGSDARQSPSTLEASPSATPSAAAGPRPHKAASVSSATSSTASPRLNVAALEFKPRLAGSGSSNNIHAGAGGSPSSSGASGAGAGLAGSGPGTPPKFGGGPTVPVPAAEAGGAAWYGYALAAAAASSSTSSSAGVTSPNPGSSPNTAAAGTSAGLLSSSPNSAGHATYAGSNASPPISPSPSHTYPRSVRPTPLRKQVGTDDDEDEDEMEHNRHGHHHHHHHHHGMLGDDDGNGTVQYATYPSMDGYAGGYAPPAPSSSHGSATSSSLQYGQQQQQHQQQQMQASRKSHEYEEDDDDDEFSPFGSSRHVQSRASGFAALGGGGGGGGGGPPGMASSLVARMMAGTGSPLGPSGAHPRAAGSASGSPSHHGYARNLYTGREDSPVMMMHDQPSQQHHHQHGLESYGPGPYGGSPDFGAVYRGPPPHTGPHGAGANHMQYLQGQLPSTGGGSSGDVFSSGYQPGGDDGYGSAGAGGAGGVSDAEFNELEAAIEADEAERRRANMTPFDVLYSILNGNSSAAELGEGAAAAAAASARKSGVRWTPKQIETALSRNGWDVEATLNWIMAGGMNTIQQQQPGSSGSNGGGENGKDGASTTATPGVPGPLSSSLSSSASSSLSSSVGTGTNSMSALSASSASTSATSATPRGGGSSSAAANGKSAAGSSADVGAGTGSGPSTSLPHFVHHYVPGSTKPSGFASPRANFTIGGGPGMARSGSGAGSSSNHASGAAGGGNGAGSAGLSSSSSSFRPISYSNGVAVLPREAFQSHKAAGGGALSSSGAVGSSSSGATNLAGGASSGTAGTRSPRIGSPSPFHIGPLTPTHFGSGGSNASPLPSPGLNGPSTPGGSSGSTARVCRYFLAGECRRFDCRFSHDLGRALCRFWLRGQCLNDPCGFLHDFEVVNKLARGMKSSLTPSAASTPGEVAGGDGYFAPRPGGDSTGSPGGARWMSPSGGAKSAGSGGGGGGGEGNVGPTWVGRTGSSHRDRLNQDGALDYRAFSGGRGPGSNSGHGHGAPSASSSSSHQLAQQRPGTMAVPDADAPDEFPVLGRPAESGNSKKGSTGIATRANGSGGGPRWVLAASGSGTSR